MTHPTPPANDAAPERDPIVAAYFERHPSAYQDVMTSLEKIDKRSVDQTRQCKIVLWRLAGKIADSGTTDMTHEQLYEHIKKAVEI